jgi:hypothetical protein
LCASSAPMILSVLPARGVKNRSTKQMLRTQTLRRLRPAPLYHNPLVGPTSLIGRGGSAGKTVEFDGRLIKQAVKGTDRLVSEGALDLRLRLTPKRHRPL